MKKLNTLDYCSNTMKFKDEYKNASKEGISMRLLEKHKLSEGLSLVGASKKTQVQKGES